MCVVPTRTRHGLTHTKHWTYIHYVNALPTGRKNQEKHAQPTRVTYSHLAIPSPVKYLSPFFWALSSGQTTTDRRTSEKAGRLLVSHAVVSKNNNNKRDKTFHAFDFFRPTAPFGLKSFFFAGAGVPPAAVAAAAAPEYLDTKPCIKKRSWRPRTTNGN